MELLLTETLVEQGFQLLFLRPHRSQTTSVLVGVGFELDLFRQG
ncbi:MAG TPA: hypothetical protein VN040_17745 [Pseudosphingobacterium sp.]|nr:hypothetical protein [Pseudosphingobacterium sp.]